MTLVEKFRKITQLKSQLDSSPRGPEWDEAFLESVTWLASKALIHQR